MPIEFMKEKSSSPCKATATRALSTSQGAPLGAGGSFLPLYSAGGPPDRTKASHLGEEEEDAITSQNHSLLMTSWP
jgi:hypothetical protein